MASAESLGCTLVRAGGPYDGVQGLATFEGISAQSAGARHLCLHLITIPAGGRARAHLHAEHESAIYVVSGQAEMWYGEGLREHMAVRAGDFIHIPAGVPHLPFNPSDTDPVTAVIARTDPNEQESIVLLPELDNVH